jgi:hypothetical protein
MTTRIEREKPTGGKPTGLLDTGTERYLKLPEYPYQSKINCSSSLAEMAETIVRHVEEARHV